MGFLLQEGETAVVLSIDTGPTEEIWQRARALSKLSAVFLEVTFPNAMEPMARLAKHLTPEMFAAEVQKLTCPGKVIAVHIKAPYYDQVVAELKALNMPGLEIGIPGKEYCF